MKKFWVFFAITFLIRIFLFNFQSFNIDMGTWEAWAYRLINRGFSSFYSPNFYTEYFPGYLYFLWGIGNIYHLIFPSLSFSSFQFEVIVKLVSTFFDLATSYLIYKVVFSARPRVAPLASLIYFANPAVIFNSSVWGQIDGIYTFFLFLSAYLLTVRLNKYFSIIFSSVSFLIKPQAIFQMPVLFIKFYRDFKLQVLITSALLFAASIIFLSFPFFPNNPISGFIAMAERSANLYPYTSLYAFNFWSFFGWWKLDTENFFIPFKLWGIILYAISLFGIMVPLFVNKNKKKNMQIFFLSLTLSFFSSFIFLTRMHERYLFPVLAFYLIFAVSGKKYLALYFLISLIHLLNLWYVYYFYDFIYNNFNAANNLIYNFIDQNHNIFSGILMASFFSIFLKYYDSYLKKIN